MVCDDVLQQYTGILSRNMAMIVLKGIRKETTSVCTAWVVFTAQLERLLSLVTSLPFMMILMERVTMIVARIDKQECSSMSSTLRTVLLTFLVVRLNDRYRTVIWKALHMEMQLFWCQHHDSKGWGFAGVGPQHGWRNAVPALWRECTILCLAEPCIHAHTHTRWPGKLRKTFMLVINSWKNTSWPSQALIAVYLNKGHCSVETKPASLQEGQLVPLCVTPRASGAPALAPLLWASFHCRGLLVKHKHAGCSVKHWLLLKLLFQNGEHITPVSKKNTLFLIFEHIIFIISFYMFTKIYVTDWCISLHVYKLNVYYSIVLETFLNLFINKCDKSAIWAERIHPKRMPVCSLVLANRK